MRYVAVEMVPNGGTRKVIGPFLNRALALQWVRGDEGSRVFDYLVVEMEHPLEVEVSKLIFPPGK